MSGLVMSTLAMSALAGVADRQESTHGALSGAFAARLCLTRIAATVRHAFAPGQFYLLLALGKALFLFLGGAVKALRA